MTSTFDFDDEIFKSLDVSQVNNSDLPDLSDADAVDNWIHQQNLIAYASFRALGVL
jgi:hypothetical protein